MAIVTRTGPVVSGSPTDSGQNGIYSLQRLVSVEASVLLNRADNFVVVNKAVGSATLINLPTTPVLGETHTIIDGKGDAANNLITVVSIGSLINSQNTFLISTPYAAITVRFNGLNWNII